MIVVINKGFIVCFLFLDCILELYLMFDFDFSDMFGKSIVVVNWVLFWNDSVIFNGDGELCVWWFSGGYIGN